MPFEFDPAKSAANKAKHGIDFEVAQALWDDPGAIEAEARIGGEPRFIVIGSAGGYGRLFAPCAATMCGSYRCVGPGKRRSGAMRARETISAEEFDRKFDDGEDVSAYIDWSTARRVNLEPKRVNVDFPTWVVKGLDREAQRLGVTRQALIKMWIAERLQATR